MNRDFRPEDEGKSVRTSDGDKVGTIESIEGSNAHVRPEHDLSRSTRQRLDWTDESKETYQISRSHVDSVTDDDIHLTEDL